MKTGTVEGNLLDAGRFGPLGDEFANRLGCIDVAA
jgi:hypothetical protein